MSALRLLMLLALLGGAGCVTSGGDGDGEPVEAPVCPDIDYVEACLAAGYPHVMRAWRLPIDEWDTRPDGAAIGVGAVDQPDAPVVDGLLYPVLTTVWCVLDPERPRDSQDVSPYYLHRSQTDCPSKPQVSVLFPHDPDANPPVLWRHYCSDVGEPAWRWTVYEGRPGDGGQEVERHEFPENRACGDG